MSHWIEELADYHQRDRACVLVTLVGIEGSSPREAGAKMIVSRESASGTLGGGTVEHIAQERARELLAAGPDRTSGPLLEEFVLNDAIDQACGGRMSLLFEPVWPAAFQIGLFGAGHVGQALVKALADVPCRVHWVDSRAEVFPEQIPAVASRIVADRPEEQVARLPDGAYVIAMTHSHEIDLEIVAAALTAGRFAFIGTIGSKTKRGRFRSQLRDRGLAPEAIERLVIPIGLPGVGGKRPAEIGISVAAQLLQLREERDRQPA
ncbi:xanthine dehydrogenase accessory protein XdhC [Arhodomonas sp. AD133]|uniref:xanthine dehydrogenase accessory protein XdhC n=1 Tax=Arhodomonas sp. AD133 TaxID=3415009 RepID=UPI003EBB28D7